MSQLNIVIDSWEIKGLKEYLRALNGIQDIVVKSEKYLDIYLKYDSKLITPAIIKKEILLYLDIKVPSFISFNKYAKIKTKNYTIVRNDICCEYCFKNAIEELMEIDGIEKVKSNYMDDYFLKKSAEREKMTINIEYNPKIIDTLKMKQIELNLTI